MLRSLFAGVSGMRAHQLDMDIIADNIANVNTAGFKASRMTFKEVYSQVLRQARAPSGSQGGTNPMQVGLGVTMASVDTLLAQGAPQATGRDTDLAIDGAGFFILTPDDGLTRYYTRAGNFSVDSQGNLVYVNGMKVMGWNADLATDSLDTTQPPVPVVISSNASIEAQATTAVNLAGNLDSRLFGTSQVVVTSLTVYDSLGEEHLLTLRFTPRATPLEWDVEAELDGNPVLSGGPALLVFNPDGTWRSGLVTTDLWNPGNGADPLSLTVDLSAMTQFARESDPFVLNQDGYAAGTLVRFTIDDTGLLTGVFSNGLMRRLGQIALATFPNPQALVKQSDTLFAESPNSGQARVGTANSGPRGKLVPGFLEMSNVDLSQEFTNLILAQRGFQANSRVITSSDEMLQELMNLKR